MKLPPLPSPDEITGIEAMRNIQREAYLAALEEAAKVCYDQRNGWSVEGAGQVALTCAGDAIRALAKEIE